MEMRELILLEFAWTTWEDSCKAHLLTVNGLRECRRPKGHKGRHASGFGDAFRLWE